MEPLFLLDLDEHHHVTFDEPRRGPNERRAIRRHRLAWAALIAVIVLALSWIVGAIAS